MKHLLPLAFILFCISTSSSQDFEALDILLFPGEYNSHEAFHKDQFGNQFIAGKGRGAIDFDFGSEITSLPATSNRDLYLVKYDVDRNLAWLRSFDGTSTSNHVTGLVSDEDGNIYMTGTFAGSLQLTDDGQNEITSDASNPSAFVAKFDNNGVLLWKFTLGNDDNTQTSGKILHFQNKLIVQLEYSGTFDVDPGPNETLLDGSSNAMLVYDLDGNLIEANSHKGKTFIIGSTMDEEGNLYICGNFSGLVSVDFKSNFSMLSIGQFDAFVVKYDKEFNLVWQKRVSKSLANISFRRIALDNSNNVIIAATLEEGITIGSAVTGNDANYIINISETGEYTRLTELLPQPTNITTLETNSKNQIIISGNFNEVIDLDPSEGIFELIPQPEGADYFFAVYDSELGLIGADQMHAFIINTHTVYIDESDKIYILTDIAAQGEAAFGSEQFFTSEFEENFIYYELDIEGCSTTSDSISLDACNELIINGETYITSGEYQQTLTNAGGCDSILNLFVTIYSSYDSITSINSCGPFEIDGVIYNNSGVHFNISISSEGCDSITTYNIEVINIEKSMMWNEESIASSEGGGDSYQWYDCDTNLPIENETSFDFSPEYSGSFKVEITKGFCTEFSDCIDFILVNTKDYNSEITISPNPTEGILYIGMENSNIAYEASLFDMSGKEVIRPIQLNAGWILDLSHILKGMYLLKLEHQNQSVFKKIVISH